MHRAPVDAAGWLVPNVFEATQQLQRTLEARSVFLKDYAECSLRASWVCFESVLLTLQVISRLGAVSALEQSAAEEKCLTRSHEAMTVAPLYWAAGL